MERPDTQAAIDAGWAVIGEGAPDWQAAIAALQGLIEAAGYEANKHLTSCGTQHLAAERALRIVERYGWPSHVDLLEWVSSTAVDAGQAQNIAALELNDCQVPF